MFGDIVSILDNNGFSKYNAFFSLGQSLFFFHASTGLVIFVSVSFLILSHSDTDAIS